MKNTLINSVVIAKLNESKALRIEVVETISILVSEQTRIERIVQLNTNKLEELWTASELLDANDQWVAMDIIVDEISNTQDNITELNSLLNKIEDELILLNA